MELEDRQWCALLYLMIQRGFKLSPINILACHISYTISLSLSILGMLVVVPFPVYHPGQRPIIDYWRTNYSLYQSWTSRACLHNSNVLHPAAQVARKHRDDLTIIYPITVDCPFWFDSIQLWTFRRTWHSSSSQKGHPASKHLLPGESHNICLLVSSLYFSFS